jgi:hypothetical protein
VNHQDPVQQHRLISGMQWISCFSFGACLKGGQMIPKRLYRLNEYRISEFSDGRLWWDTHSGFGTQIGGACFVNGNILVIGARCNEENGFLKLEFIGTLKRLPLWNRTRYYCFASALLDVSSGQNISVEQLQQMASVSSMTISGSTSPIIDSPGSFGLGRYQLSIAADGNISWKSCGGTHQIVGGAALIESDVLFIGPGKYEKHQQNKKDFFTTLRTHPKWDRTTFWCRSLALKPVLPDGKSSLPPTFHENKRIRQPERIPVKSHRSEFAKQAWSQMTDYCAGWAEEVKARWPHRVWSKRKKKCDIGDKMD